MDVRGSGTFLLTICRRWRHVVSTSQRRLGLRILCKYGAPVEGILSSWPTLGDSERDGVGGLQITVIYGRIGYPHFPDFAEPAKVSLDQCIITLGFGEDASTTYRNDNTLRSCMITPQVTTTTFQRYWRTPPTRRPILLQHYRWSQPKPDRAIEAKVLFALHHCVSAHITCPGDRPRVLTSPNLSLLCVE